MNLTEYLDARVRAGVRRIGQLVILCADGAPPYRLCHVEDAATAEREPPSPDLERIEGPDRAREVSTFDGNGNYRFLKAEPSLRRGWLMTLRDAEELKRAIDGIYPAAIGLARALADGTANPQHLREKLARQTGMYRFAGGISDEGARELVGRACHPDHCAKRILWRIGDDLPLADDEAARGDGLPAGVPDAGAIPLLCREPCNHLVALCREASKREHAASQAASSPAPRGDSH